MMALDERRQMQREFHFGERAEEMESLVLDDDIPNGVSSTMIHHPLSSPSKDDRSLRIVADTTNSPSSSSSSSVNTLIDPPSYADVVFTSFDDAKNSGPKSENFNSPDYLTINVEDPQKEHEPSSSLVPGGNAYFTYLITTNTNIPEFNGRHFSVRRRFRDVVTLADRLSESYRGFFIPQRPDKNVVESQMMQEQEFVDQRRISLEKYLRKLSNHHVIRKSEELRLFLQVQGKLPLHRNADIASRVLDGASKLPRQLLGDGLGETKGGMDLLRIFKELKQSVTNDWVGSRHVVGEDDLEFLEKKSKLQVMESQLSSVSEQAEALVKAQQEMGETTGELGLALVRMTKLETDEAVHESQRIRASDMRNVATAAVKASRLWRELNSHTVNHLDKVHDHLGMMIAVNAAFSERASALLTVQTLVSELDSMRSRTEKLETASSKIFGGDRSRIQKIQALMEAIKLTEDAKSCAIQEYERIKGNNKRELERLEIERRTDFLTMLKGFITNQVGYAKKMAEVWEKVAEDTQSYAETNDTPVENEALIRSDKMKRFRSDGSDAGTNLKTCEKWKSHS